MTQKYNGPSSLSIPTIESMHTLKCYDSQIMNSRRSRSSSGQPANGVKRTKQGQPGNGQKKAKQEKKPIMTY